MVYDGCRIGQTYLSAQDGRLRIHITYPDGHHSVMSYPKFLMEQHLNRYLTDNETVDHIDKNPLNNNISNLQVLNRSEHAHLDCKRLLAQTFTCPVCGEVFTLTGIKLSRCLTDRKRGKSGPFCSRKCTGKYGTQVQNGAIKPLPITQKTSLPVYTTNKHLLSLHEETHEVDGANSGNPSTCNG